MASIPGFRCASCGHTLVTGIKMRITSIIWIAVTLIHASAAYSSDDVRSLCTATETVIFSCEHKNKVASVCASLSSNKSLDYVQYRFGSKTAEISIPATSPFNMDLVNAYTTTGAHGGSETINFRNREYVYKITNIWNMRGPSETDVTVFKNGSKISYLQCKSVTDDRLLHSFIEEHHFKRGPDLR
jgi:hypothetical protein